jgi:hypothetical protein
MAGSLNRSIIKQLISFCYLLREPLKQAYNADVCIQLMSNSENAQCRSEKAFG